MTEHTSVVTCDDIKSSRLHRLLEAMDRNNDEDIIAEIDLRIESLDLEIRRLRQLRQVLAHPAQMMTPAPTSSDEVAVRPYVRRIGKHHKNGVHKPQRKKLSGLALAAHNNRVAVAKAMMTHPRGMTVREIALATGRKANGMSLTLKHEAFARLSYEGNESLYTLTVKGRELAKHG